MEIDFTHYNASMLAHNSKLYCNFVSVFQTKLR